MNRLASYLHVRPLFSPNLSHFLTFITKCGALDMLSNPPTIATLEWPSWIDCVPYTIDFMPDEHTLFTVVQVTVTGRPANIAACLAGAWPTPAVSTLPRTTSYTSLGLSLIDSNDDFIQWLASYGPLRFVKAPIYDPIAVLFPATIYTSCSPLLHCFSCPILSQINESRWLINLLLQILIIIAINELIWKQNSIYHI